MFKSTRGGNRMPRRNYVRSVRPARQWLGLVSQAITTGAGANVTSLLAFEAPTLTVGTPVTADPPEDQTILRVIADFSLDMATIRTSGWG